MTIKYKAILAIMLIINILTACTDSFLKETPYNRVTAGNYYTTVAGITGGINGLYGSLRQLYITEDFMNICENGTDMTIWPDMSGRPPVDPTTGYVRNFWNTCYINLNRCNEVIKALEVNELPGLTESLRKRYLGEARFIRAHYFDHLVKQFGDVPMQLEPTVGIVTTSKRVPQAEVWEQIIKDLTFAIANLPVNYPNAGTDYGRITKFAAMHSLSKVLLTAKRTDLASLTLAKNYADSVINSGRYALVSNPFSLWDITLMRNSEVIFPVLYSRDPNLNGTGNRSHMFWVSDYTVHRGLTRTTALGRPFIRCKTTRFGYELFLNPAFDSQSNNRLLDRRAKDWFQTDFFVNTPTYSEVRFNPITKQPQTINKVRNDLAMIATYWYNKPSDLQFAIQAWPNWVWLPEHMEPIVRQQGIQSVANPNGVWPDNVRFNYILFYPYLRKHLDPLRPDVNFEAGSRDVFVYRLAETYLLAAEAAFLLGDNTSAATYINVVRKRAERTEAQFVNRLLITPQAVTADFILDERGRELLGEGHRWYDLKRFDKLTERMSGDDTSTRDKVFYQTPSFKFEKYMELRPIPRDFMLNLTNPQEFPQNPGYSN